MPCTACEFGSAWSKQHWQHHFFITLVGAIPRAVRIGVC